MRKAKVFVDGILAGELQEVTKGKQYRFVYRDNYVGLAVSLTMPTTQKIYDFDRFPPFFEGLLPEGVMLEALLRKQKLDRDDYMSQLLVIGKDMVGNVTVEAIE